MASTLMHPRKMVNACSLPCTFLGNYRYPSVWWKPDGPSVVFLLSNPWNPTERGPFPSRCECPFRLRRYGCSHGSEAEAPRSAGGISRFECRVSILVGGCWGQELRSTGQHVHPFLSVEGILKILLVDQASVRVVSPLRTLKKAVSSGT